MYTNSLEMINNKNKKLKDIKSKQERDEVKDLRIGPDTSKTKRSNLK